MHFSENPATKAVRASLESDQQHGAVVPPLHLSSTFAFSAFGEKREYDYTRSGNPTRDALGDAICNLEGGAGAVVTSSGMAALNLVLQLLKPGDLLVAPHVGKILVCTALLCRGLSHSARRLDIRWKLRHLRLPQHPRFR